jgi:hypothetical protein
VAIEGGDQLLDASLAQHDVLLREMDVFAGGFGNAPVHTSGESGVARHFDQPEGGVGASDVGDLAAPLTAIADHQNLEIGISLRLNGCESLAEHLRPFEAKQNDGNARSIHRSELLARARMGKRLRRNSRRGRM